MGGAPFEFTVDIINNTPALSYPLFTLVVSMGHCSCSTSNMVAIAPSGAMSWRQTNGSWETIPYVREGGGMDYVGVDQGFGLLVVPSGTTAQFTIRVSLFPNAPPYTPPTYVAGKGTIDISLVQPDRSFFPTVPAPAASLPIDVATS
jgi:hypothetical protein